MRHTPDTRGDWRPAIYTRRRHFVPVGSPTRPYDQRTLGSGLCGCPGYLDEKVRHPDWPSWKFCQYCLPLWLKEWPPHGFQPNCELAVRFPDLAPLHDWWWRGLGISGRWRLLGFRLHDAGIDCLRLANPTPVSALVAVHNGTAAELQRLDPAGLVRGTETGPLGELISRAVGG